jgi:hypothetical protein
MTMLSFQHLVLIFEFVWQPKKFVMMMLTFVVNIIVMLVKI